MAPVSLGILELDSIARGVRVSDSVVKKAIVEILRSGPVSGGKHLIMLRGEVAEIEESMAEGAHFAADSLVDKLRLPMAHESLWPLLHGHARGDGWANDAQSESVCIVETRTVCSAVLAADGAVKAAPVTLRDMQLAVGITGKAFFTMTGRLYDIEAAADTARALAESNLLALEVIAQPAQEIRGHLFTEPKDR